MRTLSANHIEFPEYHKTLSLDELGQVIDQKKVFLGGKERKEQRFRLESLMRDIKLNGMTHPIIVNTWNNNKVAVGNQRVWYARRNGYTHIDCYCVPSDSAYIKVFQYTNSETHWQKYTNSYYDH